MNFNIARDQMLAQQIRAWNVLDDRVLGVLHDTARETFVAESDRDLAFADVELPIGHGQTMMTPMVEGRLLQALAVEPLDEVLEIGTGSGYLTACLARLGRHVHTVEIFEDLSASAASRLDAAGLVNVEFEVADGLALPTTRQYDVIAVTGSVPTLGDYFISKLKPRGRIFAVVGRAPAMEAELITRQDDGTWSALGLFETALAPLINADTTEPFVL